MYTTTIGAYPKPGYMPITDWFSASTTDYTAVYESELTAAGAEAEGLFVRAAAEVIADQIEAGIDVVTDGEVRRENYIHYQCRHMNGISFADLREKRMRGVVPTLLPTITGPVSARDTPLVHDYLAAQAVSKRPVKVTIPGPMTIIDSTIDAHYGNAKALGADLAAAINRQVLDLAKAGCLHIQVDEPLMAREPAVALAHGIDQLAMCFHGLPDRVTRIVHACCGYPNHLDEPDYPKADPETYIGLAPALDAAPIDQISLEDAHQPNDFGELLTLFESTTIILGVVAIARRRVETVDEIHARLEAALDYLPPEHLIAAPDCGLGYLGRRLALTKLTNLCQAASRFH